MLRVLLAFLFLFGAFGASAQPVPETAVGGTEQVGSGEPRAAPAPDRVSVGSEFSESAGGRAARALMDRLRRDIQLLKGLVAAQKALLTWNRSRADAGAAPTTLPPGLCTGPELRAWCELLPATFTGRRWGEP